MIWQTWCDARDRCGTAGRSGSFDHSVFAGQALVAQGIEQRFPKPPAFLTVQPADLRIRHTDIDAGIDRFIIACSVTMILTCWNVTVLDGRPRAPAAEPCQLFNDRLPQRERESWRCTTTCSASSEGVVQFGRSRRVACGSRQMCAPVPARTPQSYERDVGSYPGRSNCQDLWMRDLG
jgi:hypothetical protein